MYHYHKTNRGYALIDDNTKETLFEAEEIAIKFDKDHSVLLRHGPSDRVLKEYKKELDDLKAHDRHDIAIGLAVISSRHWDLEELNKVLDICDYCGRVWRKVQEQAEGYRWGYAVEHIDLRLVIE